ncbi:DUF4446 family protein [Candidatus Gottesmanbacteria bacterium]|nr:DUF4446 family protein [Candidatus Gottesmanbacteria bacterium]
MVLIIAILGVVFLWLCVLTFFVVRNFSHYNRLTQGITNKGLSDVLESLLQDKQTSKKRIKEIQEVLEHTKHEGLFHIQRIGIVRFNPFSDTGGAQSFTIAILDGKNNGIVMTSLYTRAGNRWYIKEISDAKGKGVELSKEEESAIRKAAPHSI